MKRFFLLSGILLGLSACNNAEQKKEDLKTVNVVTAQIIENKNTRSYTFISAPYRVTELSFRVGGPVNDFDVQNGQFFRKGQLIAAVDDRDYIIQKNRAEAAFIQAEADYKRVSALYWKDNISAANFEKAKAVFEKAEADYNDAKNALNDTRLYAPFDGYVQKTYIEKFCDVKPSMPVVTFIDLSKVKAEAYITEDMATLLRGKENNCIDIKFGALKNESQAPVETYVTQSATDNNISYLLTTIIENKDNKLMGGMTGTLDILYKTPISSSSIIQKRVVIPQTAVGNNPQSGTFVWKVTKDNTIKRHPVKCGVLLKNNSIEITEGLEPGERIAASGIYQLSENEKIRPIN